MTAAEFKEAVRAEVGRLVAVLPENYYDDLDGPIFTDPLVGCAAADDPLFRHYRDEQVIGPFHRTPAEWLPGAMTVISWILPVAPATRAANRAEKSEPARAWAITRTFGEKLNNRLRAELVVWLQGLGAAAMAPVLDQGWGPVEADSGPASNWSERHAAYAAGLGTFSLNDGLISAAGMAHRCGSVITTLALSADPRPYGGVRDWCLFHARESCGACIRRCPVGAISPAGHDKRRCRDYTYGTLQPRLAERYGVPIAGCGLCQTGVPCESRNPCA